MTVAAGVFAPGHLGELTRFVPFEMIDDVLAMTRRAQARVRLLPARVVMYLLLAGCLFAELGYGQVWAKLVSGLGGLPLVSPSSSALRQARQRLGPAPMRALFDLLRGPAATTAAQVRWRGLLMVVLDGTFLSVADSPANTARYAKQRCNNGTSSGYPLLRLSALLTCGTRSVIDAVFDPLRVGELDQARILSRSLRPGMLLLADRYYDAADFLATVTTTGAGLLIRGKANRRLPVIRRLPDGSWLSRIGALNIRVIEAQIRITTSQGTRTGDYRLRTTLLDPYAYPAGELVRLYHERWEIETAYLELKSSILGGRVLRARTPDGIDQELHALLVVYQILRTAMLDATDSRPGTDPDRASLTTALNTARDQIVHAAGVITDTVIDLVGAIGAAVLDNLLPERRVRTKTRMTKRSNSKYQARGPNIDRRSYRATTSINIIDPSP
ncbi:IS4 family transposase [Paractinoplanes rishiriensis]|uniref:IS4 family transposase n=1 Tax=Paractinoplanes rishiriensis TaxID=1050105 RepID=UPI001EF20A0C|nr:IS4 family transposase [Actinoplanes rishiriensis]